MHLGDARPWPTCAENGLAGGGFRRMEKPTGIISDRGVDRSPKFRSLAHVLLLEYSVYLILYFTLTQART